MSRATLSIELLDARFCAFHGVYGQERIVGNEFVVDLRAELPVASGGGLKDAVADDLDSTVSYADLYECVARCMERPVDLIEHLAAAIVDDVVSRWPRIEKVSLRVVKVAPPIPSADCRAAVTLRWER